MFLQFYNFEKKKFKSPASRFTFILKNNFNLNYYYKNLIFKQKWNAGRNASGKLVNLKKNSLKRINKQININYNYRFKQLALITNFHWIHINKKILFLLFFSNGSAMYLNATENKKLFSFFFINNFFEKNFKINQSILMLFQIKKLIPISSLELLPGLKAQYARSSGTFGKILNFNIISHTALIQLPSTKKKMFSFYSVGLLGKNVFKLAIKLVNNKSGFWRNCGVKSVVRGVAKNPVDHPNGGRTKSIKTPRTPWGKIAKLK